MVGLELLYKSGAMMTPRVNDTKDNLENSVRRLMISDVASKILEVDGYFIDLGNVVFLKVMEIPEVYPQTIPSIEKEEEENMQAT